MALKFYSLIIHSFCIIFLCLLGCSSSNVEDEASEAPTAQEDTFGDEAEGVDEYGDAVEFTDELELEEGEIGDGEAIADGLPEDPPALDVSEPSVLPPLPEDAPLVSEEESGLPSLPVAAQDDVLPGPDLTVTEPSPNLSSLGTAGDSDFLAPAGVPQKIPVKKIKSYPYRRAGVLVNAVYIARSGDDLSSISQKIFGTDHTADLLSVNPNLHRGVDVGDKVYYNSPNRPNDSENLLFYYEDIGAQSQQYNVARNDNIRDLAEQFFGERESWKELWATNPEVESKWTLSEGLVLRYWASAVSAPPLDPPEEVVQEDVHPLTPPMPEEVGVPDLAGDITSGEIPPSQPSEEPSLGEELSPPTFPDTAGEVPPPPPVPDPLSEPPPPLGMSEPPANGMGDLLEDDTSLMILVIGIVIVMFGLLIAIRKKSKRRKMRVDIGDTQI